jgi:glycosyltransferase involved in cell wall biosynthesis
MAAGAGPGVNLPRLAIVTTHPVQYNAPLFRALAASGLVDVRVFYTWSQAAAGERLDPEFGVRFAWDLPLLEGYAHEFVPNVARRPGVGFFGIRTPQLRARLLEWRPDAVLVYGWNRHAHLDLMIRLHGRLPIFFRGDSTLLDPSPAWRRALRRAWLGWIYRHVDHAFATGMNSADYFRWCGLPDARITIAPHSVDNERFADPGGTAQRQADEWRRELGIADDAVVFLFAGKLIDKKAPDVLLRAFAACAGGSHLVFVGSGDAAGRLAAMAEGRRDVHFLPFRNQSQMPAVYRIADVFVLPSRGPGETWGLALNEAMASGRLVAASDRVGGARDLVTPEAGWTFGASDADALGAVLRDAQRRGRPALLAAGTANVGRIAAWSTAVAAGAMARQVAAATRPGRPAGRIDSRSALAETTSIAADSSTSRW